MQVRQPVDVAHVIGWFFLGAMFVAAIGVSAVLSAMYFSTITPPDQGWLVWLFLSFTEIGMIGWLAAFFLMKHHGFHKGLSLLMACAHGGASFVIASVQLNHLIHHTSPGTGGAAFNTVGTTLEIIFALDLLAVFVDVISRYFEVPGHYFRNPPTLSGYGATSSIPQGGNLIPQGGNLIPRTRIEQIQGNDWVTAQHQVVGGREQAQLPDPLAGRQLLPSPRRQEVSLAHTQQIAAPPKQGQEDPPIVSWQTVKGAVNLLTRKGKGSSSNGLPEDPAPGPANETTSGNGFASATMSQVSELDLWKKVWDALPDETKASYGDFPAFVRHAKLLDQAEEEADEEQDQAEEEEEEIEEEDEIQE